MKKYLSSLCIGLSLTTPVCVAQSTSATSTADVSAVRKVVADETDAFFTKDRAQWASYWAHEPYISWTAQGGANSVMTQAGWNAYSAMFSGYFTDSTPGPVTTFLRENVQVTVIDKVATVSFLQTRQRADGSLKSREVRVLEKQENNWKLIYAYSRNME